MVGKYTIKVKNKKTTYELVIDRNITVISGDSARGKTSLVKLIEIYNNGGLGI